MASRYVIRRAVPLKTPRSSVYWDDGHYLDDAGQQTITVIEDPVEPWFTGVYDSNGEPLYRVPDSVPIGFHHR